MAYLKPAIKGREARMRKKCNKENGGEDNELLDECMKIKHTECIPHCMRVEKGCFEIIIFFFRFALFLHNLKAVKKGGEGRVKGCYSKAPKKLRAC